MGMCNVSVLRFKDVESKYGHLIPIEARYDIPYEVKRGFYIYGVPNGKTRGYHAHRWIYQTLICLKGSLKVKLKDTNEEEIYVLDDPTIGLMIGPWIWNEMFDYSEDCVLLVLCSDNYDENDYIRNYDVYETEVRNTFRKVLV